MSDNPVLLAEERTEFGKGAARRARRAAKVPTVLSIAPLLARAIHEVFEDGSVTSLFN